MHKGDIESDLELALQIQENEDLQASDFILAQQLQKEYNSDYQRINPPSFNQRAGQSDYLLAHQLQNEEDQRAHSRHDGRQNQYDHHFQRRNSTPAWIRRRQSESFVGMQNLRSALDDHFEHGIRTAIPGLPSQLSSGMVSNLSRMMFPGIFHRDDSLNYEDLLELEEATGVSHSQGLKSNEIDTLPTLTFSKNGQLDSQRPAVTDESSCPICFSEYVEKETLRTLPCLHKFHKDCIDEWIKYKAVCPICRALIKDQLNPQLKN